MRLRVSPMTIQVERTHEDLFLNISFPCSLNNASMFQVLEKEGLKVTDVLVVLDRQQGGVAALKAKGITVHRCVNLLRNL